MTLLSTIESSTKTFLLSHLCWLILVGAGWIGFHAWLQEHDQRLLSDQVAKVAQQQISDLQAANAVLQKQIADSDAQAQKTISALQAQSAQVKTNAQAIAAMPDVSSLPATIRPIQNSSDFLLPEADLLPLFQQLATGKEDAVALTACQAARANDVTIEANKDKEIAAQGQEIAAIKKKPSFWHRVGSITKQVLIGVGIGVVARSAA